MVTYARSRLRVGILSVGTWVILSSVFLFKVETISDFLFPLTLTESIFFFLGLYLIVSMPFDFFGGYLLPRKFKKSTQSFFDFFLTYCRGVIFHSAFLFLIAYQLLYLAGYFPFSDLLIPLLLSTFLIQSILGIFQPQIARVLSKFQISKELNPSLPYEVWESSDIGFTGGITLFRKGSIIPKRWVDDFTPDQIKLLLIRRNFLKQNRTHLFGIFGAMVFNLLGVCMGYVSCKLLGITLNTHGYFSFLVVWASSISLWSFFGLLILPSYSQTATLIGDEIWKKEDRNQIADLILSLDQMQDQEPKRPPNIQKIFHPIASVYIRIKALSEEQKNLKGAWHIARYTLFFSWSTLSFLSRSVHCNVGRPHLWVFLPSDG